MASPRLAIIAASAVVALIVLGGATAQDPERVLFHSSFDAAPNFGYDYQEGVERMREQECVMETYDCGSAGWKYLRYRMDVTNSNFDYLAKKLDTLPQGSEKESYVVAFRIRAAQNDGRESGFSASFSTEPEFSKGDGKVTGSFRNSVKVKFQENGDDWSLKLTEVVDGAEKTLTTGTTHGSDEHRLFHFLVDNRASDGPRIELQDYSGTGVLAADTNPAFEGKTVRSQWFVAYGFGSSERTTVLVADAPSTRIYDTHPKPPVVEAVEFEPNPPEPDEALKVIATITDDWTVERALVFYRVETNPSQQVEMQRDVGNRWTATIPGQDANSTVSVRIEAYDDQDLVGHSDGEYSYTVGSGSAITKDPNSEKPQDPGGGGVETGNRLSFRSILIAFALTVIGLSIALLVFREAGKRKGWTVIFSTVAFVAVFLLFQADAWGVKGWWLNGVAALAAVGTLSLASKTVRSFLFGGSQ